MQLVRYALVYSTVILSYYAQFYFAPVRDNFLLSIVACVALGFACAQVGLLPLHDASHCSFSHSPWLWRILGATHDFINGCSYLNWCYQHMLGHHPYTNVENADPDIITGNPDIRRIKATQPWHSRYIGQEIYVPILYGLLGMKVRFQDINLLLIQKENDSIRVNPPSTWHFNVFWLGKLFFVFYRFVLPLLFVSYQKVLFNFVVADLVSSYWLAFCFQANHVVDGVEFPLPNEKNEIKQDWAELQVLTAQDYAHGSLFWTNCAGALNYQVVHHLFPNVSLF
jgi:fatty acid desaturase